MNLSADLFEQIVTSLAAGRETNLPSIALPPDKDQRRTRRVTLERNTRVRLIPLTDALAPGPVDVTLRDVSPGGAGFLFPVRVSLDEQFVLLLPDQDGGDVAILCGVAYWQPVHEDTFLIGATFNRVLRQGSAQPKKHAPPMNRPVRRAV